MLLVGVFLGGSKIAKEKFPCAELICADAEETTFENKYDRVMVFNAPPNILDHQFPNTRNILPINIII